MYVKSGYAMIRTVNLESTLNQIAPELSRRLRRSCMADWRGRLVMADGRQSVAMAISDGKVSVDGKSPPRARHYIRSRQDIGQLIIGTDEPEEIIAADGIRLGGDARQLAGVLFPNQHPMLSSWDFF